MSAEPCSPSLPSVFLPGARKWLLFAVSLLALPVVVAASRHFRPPPLPRFGQVPQFVFHDQTGALFTEADLTGKVWVVDFIFTSCSEACPLLTERMATLERHLIKSGIDSHVGLLSVSVDPERDTEARLLAYAKGWNVDAKRWKFVTGATQTVQATVVGGFKQSIERESDSAAADGFTILHGTRFALVDQKGALRGFYDVSEGSETNRLQHEIDQLLAEGQR